MSLEKWVCYFVLKAGGNTASGQRATDKIVGPKLLA